MRTQSTAWPGYAACAWALVFAALSFYWALGGTAALDTIARDTDEVALAGDAVFVAITGALKVAAALLALALVRSWRLPLPRRMLIRAAWVAGIVLLLYGGSSLIQHGLMVIGVLDVPEVLGETAARWHLALWDPWWLLGGALFVTLARRARA